MSILFWILSAAVLESLVSLLGRLLVFWSEVNVKKLAHYFIGFAVGALLGVVFLDLLPEALEFAAASNVFAAALAGFIIFFLLERFLFWYHCHDGVCPVHAVGYLVLAGDAIHNFIDGVIIAVAFLADFKLGVLTALAVIFHEVPQEIGDFIVLLHSGFERAKALFYNFLIALTTIIGALAAYAFRGGIESFLGIALGLVAGNFLYIAAADLIPELHRQETQGRISPFPQVVFVLLGVLLVGLGESLL